MTVLSADWVLPVEGPPIEAGAVVIEDGRIAAVGTAEDLGEGTHYEDAVIVPGFVNAHSHLEYAVYGGFGDGLGDFAEWITLHIQRKARIGWDEYVDVAKLGAAQCLASGVTTVGDCSYSGATAVACAELGLRATVYLEVFGVDPARALEHFAGIRDRVSDSFSTRVRPGVAHCPRSNAALGCGVAPLAELRAVDARVGVGTDSPASAPSFDFFEELRSVLLFARARAGRPDVLSAGEALELGTLGSARALGLDREVGSLVPGKRGDLAVVSLEGSAYLPFEDPAAAVVFGGSPDRVIATYVDGEARYEKGGMDWQGLTAAAHSARRAMLAQPAAKPVPAANPVPAAKPVAAPRA